MSLDGVIEPTLGLIRRLVLSLDTVQQTSFANSLLSSVHSQNKVSELHFAVVCNALIYLDKSSALFTVHNAVTQGDVISKVISSAFQGSEFEVAVSGWRQFGAASLLSIALNKVSC